MNNPEDSRQYSARESELTSEIPVDSESLGQGGFSQQLNILHLTDYAYPNFVKLVTFGEFFFQFFNHFRLMTLTLVMPALKNRLIVSGPAWFFLYPSATLITAHLADSYIGIFFTFRIMSFMIVVLDVTSFLCTFSFFVTSHIFAQFHLLFIVISHAWLPVRLSLLMKQYRCYSSSNARRLFALFIACSCGGEALHYGLQHYLPDEWDWAVIRTVTVIEVLYVIAFLAGIEIIKHQNLLVEYFDLFCVEKYAGYIAYSTYCYFKNFSVGRSWFKVDEQRKYFSEKTAHSANDAIKAFVVLALCGSIPFVLILSEVFLINDFKFLSDKFIFNRVNLHLCNRIYGVLFLLGLEFCILAPASSVGKYPPAWAWIAFGYLAGLAVMTLCLIQAGHVNVATIPGGSEDKAQLTIFNGLPSITEIHIEEILEPVSILPYAYHHTIDVSTETNLTLTFFNYKATLYFRKNFFFKKPISYRFIVSIVGLNDLSDQEDGVLFDNQGSEMAQIRILDAFELCTFGKIRLIPKDTENKAPSVVVANNTLSRVLWMNPGTYTPRLKVARREYVMEELDVRRNGRYFLILHSLLQPQLRVINLLNPRPKNDWTGYLILALHAPAFLLSKFFIFVVIYWLVPKPCKTIYFGIFNYIVYMAFAVSKFTDDKSANSAYIYKVSWLYLALCCLSMIYILVKSWEQWRPPIPMSVLRMSLKSRSSSR